MCYWSPPGNLGPSLPLSNGKAYFRKERWTFHSPNSFLSQENLRPPPSGGASAGDLWHAAFGNASSPKSHPIHDITGFCSHWTKRPSAKHADQWRLVWQGGGLCSKCSAVAMVTVDAECCWVLCVGRVWMGMTSFTESEEKQLLLQLLGLLICMTIAPNVILLFMKSKDIWQETPGNHIWICAKKTGCFFVCKKCN